MVAEKDVPPGDSACLSFRKVPAEHWGSELDALSPNGELASVQQWNGKASFLENSADPMQFVCEDGAGGYQAMKLSNEGFASTFPCFDPAERPLP